MATPAHPMALVKVSLERAASDNLADLAERPLEPGTRISLTQFAAREVSRGDELQPARTRGAEPSPALWAAMGALAGAELSWAWPQLFGIAA